MHVVLDALALSEERPASPAVQLTRARVLLLYSRIQTHRQCQSCCAAGSTTYLTVTQTLMSSSV